MQRSEAVIRFSVQGQPLLLKLEAEGNVLKRCTLMGRPRTGDAVGGSVTGVLRDASRQLANYFAGKLESLDVPLELGGTEFQQVVWDAARTIPPGEVRSYSWLAQKVGNPRAVRAVANALGANPALLFVPCHRVLRSNGDLGGFSCGIEWKELLLAHEKGRKRRADSKKRKRVGVAELQMQEIDFG